MALSGRSVLAVPASEAGRYALLALLGTLLLTLLLLLYYDFETDRSWIGDAVGLAALLAVAASLGGAEALRRCCCAAAEGPRSVLALARRGAIEVGKAATAMSTPPPMRKGRKRGHRYDRARRSSDTAMSLTALEEAASRPPGEILGDDDDATAVGTEVSSTEVSCAVSSAPLVPKRQPKRPVSTLRRGLVGQAAWLTSAPPPPPTAAAAPAGACAAPVSPDLTGRDGRGKGCDAAPPAEPDPGPDLPVIPDPPEPEPALPLSTRERMHRRLGRLDEHQQLQTEPTQEPTGDTSEQARRPGAADSHVASQASGGPVGGGDASDDPFDDPPGDPDPDPPPPPPARPPARGAGSQGSSGRAPTKAATRSPAAAAKAAARRCLPAEYAERGALERLTLRQARVPYVYPPRTRPSEAKPKPNPCWAFLGPSKP